VPTYDVAVDGDTVTTTEEHPFFVLHRGWTAVKDLRAGDLLVEPDGATIAVESVRTTGQTSTVYNFEVEGLHDYYVKVGSHWVLVHNACGAAKTGGGALVKYDADFAVGQLTQGGRATASQLDELGAAQGWTRSQSATGPLKYKDGDGIARLTIKRGSDRAPGSGSPHVEIRNDAGLRVDPYGHLVTRSSLGNHTPIEWNLP